MFHSSINIFFQDNTKPKRHWSVNHQNDNDEKSPSQSPKRPKIDESKSVDSPKSVSRGVGRPKGPIKPKVIKEKVPRQKKDPNAPPKKHKKHYLYRGRPRVMTGEEYETLMNKKPGSGRKKQAVNTNYNVTTKVKKSLKVHEISKVTESSESEDGDSSYNPTKKIESKSPKIRPTSPKKILTTLSKDVSTPKKKGRPAKGK